MTLINEFRESLNHDRPPEGLSELLQALWWDAKDNWEKAHQIAQEINSADAAWVHAYLHRREGDNSNAGYWYSRAGKPKSNQPLDEEWEQIVQSLLKS